jgi:hypothetical protein
VKLEFSTCLMRPPIASRPTIKSDSKHMLIDIEIYPTSNYTLDFNITVKAFILSKRKFFGDFWHFQNNHVPIMLGTCFKSGIISFGYILSDKISKRKMFDICSNMQYGNTCFHQKETRSHSSLHILPLLWPQTSPFYYLIYWWIFYRFSVAYLLQKRHFCSYIPNPR